MELIGKSVNHNKYGDGIITSFINDFIKIKFNESNEEKEFKYPQCFKLSIHMIDDDLENTIKSDIQTRDEQDAIKKAESDNRIHNMLVESKTRKISNVKESEAKRFSSIEEFTETYTNQVLAEIYYLKETGGKHITVSDGEFLHKKNDRYYYKFETDSELNYQSGTIITIYSIDGKKTGTIENIDENSLIISTEDNIGNSRNSGIPSLEFSVEDWRLLEALTERIKELQEKPTTITHQLISAGHSCIDSSTEIRKGQDNAVKMSQSQPITFIWGPPGTGKTETLSKIAKAHLDQGHRILMLSYSNVSVDGAIKRVFKFMPDAKAGSILRYGYPKDEEILKHKSQYSFNYALCSNEELYNRNKELREEYKNVDKLSDRAKEIKDELHQIVIKTAGREHQVIHEAQFIATTVSKAVIDKSIYTQKFDVVIFDEASMSYVPQIIFGASLATKNFVCLGDFNQLPPIVQGSHSKHLGIDIYKHTGIYDAVRQGKNHKWLCMLDTQYRSHPQIANIASDFMYYKLLKTADGIKDKRSHILSSVPEIKEAYGLADLSYMMSTCIPMQDHSRANILSAFVSFAIASRSSHNFDSGIITPYTSQARLLQNMAKDYGDYARITDPGYQNIPCATVHQFQGSEKDVIVYDSVDCYRQSHPGVLLTNMKDNYANKLFNVALTRAKGKFITVANTNFMFSKGVSNALMFGKLLSTCKQISEMNGHTITSLKLPNPIFKFVNKDDSLKLFLDDIMSAKKSIYIDIPDAPENNENELTKIVQAVNAARDRGIRAVIRAEKRENLPPCIRSEAIEHSFCMTPVAIIDKKITWYGMPWSNANFTTRYSTIQTKYFPIIRFEGGRTARSIYNILEMNKVTDQSKIVFEGDEPKNFSQYVLKEGKCKQCQSPLMLKTSSKGKYFISCTKYPACSFIDNDVDIYAQVYIMQSNVRCPKCKAEIDIKSGKYGTTIRCKGINQHKLTFNDL